MNRLSCGFKTLMSTIDLKKQSAFFILILVFLSILIADDLPGNRFSIIEDTINLLNDDDSILLSYSLENEIILGYAYDQSTGYLFCILGKTGKKYGGRLAIYRLLDNEIRKIFYGDEEHNPWKIMLADVDGDGIVEVCVGVWKKTRYDPRYDNRLFIYGFEEGRLYPKWLGSRLSSPFVDFSFYDMDNDGTDELVALEIQRNRQKRIMIYKWQSFGFITYKVLCENIEADSLLKTNFNGDLKK
jgi:hypothetical protein